MIKEIKIPSELEKEFPARIGANMTFVKKTVIKESKMSGSVKNFIKYFILIRSAKSLSILSLPIL